MFTPGAINLKPLTEKNIHTEAPVPEALRPLISQQARLVQLDGVQEQQRSSSKKALHTDLCCEFHVALKFELLL